VYTYNGILLTPENGGGMKHETWMNLKNIMKNIMLSEKNNGNKRTNTV
jgi:hypothetical protein